MKNEKGKTLIMSLDKTKIKEILVVSLSNIGDIVMTFPVMDILRRDFPEAKISVIVGPKGAVFFNGNPEIHQVFVYDKTQSPFEKLKWIWLLRRERYDLIVDLRNSFIPFLMRARRRTSPFMKRFQNKHMRQQHLERLKSIHFFGVEHAPKICLHFSGEDKGHVDALIEKYVGGGQKFIVVSPGSANCWKRWPAKKFAEVCDELIAAAQVKIVFVGDTKDRAVVRNVLMEMSHPAVDLSGKTTLTQLAYLLGRCDLALVNDSAPMHLASYIDIPVLALFGPTHPQKYGPWGSKGHAIKKEVMCPGCRKESNGGEHICIEAITVEDVLGGVKDLGLKK